MKLFPPAPTGIGPLSAEQQKNNFRQCMTCREKGVLSIRDRKKIMYSVQITNDADYLFKVKSKDYEFFVDTKGSGVTPPDALLASIGTCIGVYLRKYAEGSGIDLRGFMVDVKSEFSKDPVCFRTIDIAIDLKGLKLDERRIRAMLAFLKNCPVHNTLKANPEINIQIK